MNFYQYVKRHLIFVICLLVIGYGIVAYIHIVCPQKIGQTHTKGAAVAFVPMYNEDGSTVHAKLGIGYQQGLLIFESVVALFATLILYRMIEYYCIFFGIKRIWSYFVDFGTASVLARFPTRLTGKYTLDYVYIKASHSVYDFFDFCIGICITGILIWMIPYCIKYHEYKRVHTVGMHFGQKLLWEMKFGLHMIKSTFYPIKTWWKDIEKY